MSPPSPHLALAELDLAEAARSGDPRALEALYLRHRDALYRHAHRMLRDDALARDMVQEGFARALAAIHQTRETLYFKAWIYRIVTNLCLRELTRRQRGGDDAALGEQPETRVPDGEAAQRRTELGARLDFCLARLPARYRQILLLREVDELSYEDLAEALELSLVNVKVTLHRARARLAAVFVADELLAGPRVPVACEELARQLASAPERRGVEQHLEQCETCRRPQHRPTAEAWCLLPALPVANWPSAMRGPDGSGALGAASARAATLPAPTHLASSLGTVGSTGLWVAVVSAVLLAIAALVVLSRGAPPASLRADPSGAGESRAEGSTIAARDRAPAAAPSSPTDVALARPATAPMETRPHLRGREPLAPATSRAPRPLRARRTGSASAPPPGPAASPPQAEDPEAPPP